MSQDSKEANVKSKSDQRKLNSGQGLHLLGKSLPEEEEDESEQPDDDGRYGGRRTQDHEEAAGCEEADAEEDSESPSDEVRWHGEDQMSLAIIETIENVIEEEEHLLSLYIDRVRNI